MKENLHNKMSLSHLESRVSVLPELPLDNENKGAKTWLKAAGVVLSTVGLFGLARGYFTGWFGETAKAESDTDRGDVTAVAHAMTQIASYPVGVSGFSEQSDDTLGHVPATRQQHQVAKRAFGSEFQVNTYTAGDQTHPAVTDVTSGGFIVVWESFGQDGIDLGVYGQLYSYRGMLEGGEFQVNTYTTSNQQSPDVCGLVSGDIVVIWQSKKQDTIDWNVYGQRYSRAGVPQSNEFRGNTHLTGDKSEPSLSHLNPAGFIVVWQSKDQNSAGWDIYGQLYSARGIVQDSEFQINTYTQGGQIFPSVTDLSADGFVIVWQSDEQDNDASSGVYGQRYSRTGIPESNEFQVNTYTVGTQQSPSVAGLNMGGFVVVWESDAQDGAGWGIYGQWYSNAGIPQGNEFRVNTYTAGDQQSPSIASLGTGGFVVVWESLNQDGDGYGIYGQEYSDTVVPQGNEFQVNTYTTGVQKSPSITGLNSGGFVVTWTSAEQDGDGYGVYGRIYFSNVTPGVTPGATSITSTSGVPGATVGVTSGVTSGATSGVEIRVLRVPISGTVTVLVNKIFLVDSTIATVNITDTGPFKLNWADDGSLVITVTAADISSGRQVVLVHDGTDTTPVIEYDACDTSGMCRKSQALVPISLGKSSEGLSPLVIGGIVAGGVAGIGVLAGIGCAVYRRQQLTQTLQSRLSRVEEQQESGVSAPMPV